MTPFALDRERSRHTEVKEGVGWPEIEPAGGSGRTRHANPRPLLRSAYNPDKEKSPHPITRRLHDVRPTFEKVRKPASVLNSLYISATNAGKDVLSRFVMRSNVHTRPMKSFLQKFKSWDMSRRAGGTTMLGDKRGIRSSPSTNHLSRTNHSCLPRLLSSTTVRPSRVSLNCWAVRSSPMTMSSNRPSRCAQKVQHQNRKYKHRYKCR